MDKENLKRDRFGSLVNTDINGYNKYILQRNEKLKLKEIENQMYTLKQEIKELKTIINNITLQNNTGD